MIIQSKFVAPDTKIEYDITLDVETSVFQPSVIIPPAQLTTTAVVTNVVVVPPLPPLPILVIPATAKSSGILDNVVWKAEKDAGTPGTILPADTFNKYIDAANGRQFSAKQTGKAGMRWSTSLVHDNTATNFVYDLYVMSPDWTQQNQLELDMNVMMANGMNCFLCLQANHNSGAWDYTTTPNGACHWNPSNIKVDPSKWLPNTWKHIRLKVSRTVTGVVTYEGVELDGVYTLFDKSCVGLSAIKENWTPGVIINNLQFNGANASGTMNVYAKQIQYIYW